MDIHKSIMDIHHSGYGYPKFGGIMDIHKYMHLMSTSKPVSMTSQSLYCRGQRRVCCYCCRRAAAIITAQSGCRLLLLYASYCMHIVAVCILLPLLLPACYWYLDNLVVRYFCRSCLPAAVRSCCWNPPQDVKQSSWMWRDHLWSRAPHLTNQ